MAKIRNPIRFSDHFGFDGALMEPAGILNPTLNADTPLFIDPMLLNASEHEEMRVAKEAYDAHFGIVIKLLRATNAHGDVAWRSALRHLSFPEIKWTCLGYGGQSVSGSGSGEDMTAQVI